MMVMTRAKAQQQWKNLYKKGERAFICYTPSSSCTCACTDVVPSKLESEGRAELLTLMPKLMQAQKQELRKKSQETDKLHEGNTTTMLDYLKNYKLKILPSQRSEIWWKIQLQAKEAVADFFKGVGAVLCQVGNVSEEHWSAITEFFYIMAQSTQVDLVLTLGIQKNSQSAAVCHQMGKHKEWM